MRRFSSGFLGARGPRRAVLACFVPLLGAQAPCAEGQVARGWTFDATETVVFPRLAEWVAADGNGAIYAASDQFAAKLSRDGRRLWSLDFNFQCRSVSCDREGNFYAAGEVPHEEDKSLVCRYAPDGQLLWSYFWTPEGSWGFLDRVGAVESGVLAFGVDSYRAVVFRLDSEGNLLWNARDMPEITNDGLQCDAILDAGPWGSYFLVDPSGFAYILHVAADGQALWGFEGPGSPWDTLVALAPEGGLYVVTSEYEYDPPDFSMISILIQRLSERGEILWERRYEQEGGELHSVRAVASDDAGRLLIGGSADEDFLTVLYDAGGELLWAQRRPPVGAGIKPEIRSVVFGRNGACYAAGQALFPPDRYSRWSVATTVIKYGATGDEIWARIRGTLDRPVQLVGMVPAEDAGTTVVYGTRWAYCSEDDKPQPDIVSYGPDGDLRWQSTYAGEGVNPLFLTHSARDDDGNFYLIGSLGPSCETARRIVKVNPWGKLVWFRPLDLDDPDSRTSVIGLVPGRGGQVVVVGTSTTGWQTSVQLVLLLLDPSGREAARKSLEPLPGSDSAKMCAAPNGGVYVSMGSRDGGTLWTAYIGEDLSVAWTHEWNELGANCIPRYLVTDPSRRYLWIRLTERALFCASSGVCTEGWREPEESDHWYEDIVPDPEGALFVEVFRRGGFPEIHRFNPGLRRWTYALREQGSRMALQVDRRGNLIAATRLETSGRWAIFKLDMQGQLLWRTDHEAGRDDLLIPKKMAVAPDGSVYVASAGGTSPASRLHLVKLDANGRVLWAYDEDLQGCRSRGDFPPDLRGIFLGPPGEFFVVGVVRCPEEARSFVVAQYLEEFEHPSAFVRGDATADGEIEIVDPVAIVRHLFRGTAQLPCLDAADADDSGTMNVTDALLLLRYLFTAGNPPAAPFPACGTDLTPDSLDCETFPPCEEAVGPERPAGL